MVTSPLDWNIRVRRNRKGRGVYATQLFYRGETIEICHVLVSKVDQFKAHPFDRWSYAFDGHAAIALGAGSLYNHSTTPNADWRCRRSSQTIRIFALREIRPGDEILINYGDNIDFKVLK